MSEPTEPELPDAPVDVTRARTRLAERSRELDALQVLGRRAAEARAPEELFGSVIEVVHRQDPLDLVLVGYTWNDTPGLLLYTARPFDNDYLDAVARSVLRFLSWSAETEIETRVERLEGFDTAHGARSGFCEEDVVLLPVLDGRTAVACLLAVPATRPDERRLRLLYNASNQLSLHLERIARAHEAETDRFRAIVDAMPQGVLLTDRALRILQSNRAGEAMLRAADLADPGAFTGWLARPGLATLVEQVRDGSEAVAEGETQVAGERIWSVTVSVVPGGKDARGGLVFVLSDRTESRRMQQQLAHSETMSSLGQMISGVAHELNNPLASIVGYTQLMRGTAGADEKLAKRLDVLGREAQRCRKIVENLLSFARRREPERKLLSLNEVVNNVVGLLGYQLRVDGIRLERELDPDLPAMEGDPHQLEQVLVNLLTNAAHAIRQTGEAGAVTIATRPEPGDKLSLEIRDTGLGIPEEMRTKIFDPFFTTKGPGEGTGLGLSLVFGIITDHAGTIEALSHEGPGVTFRISLPLGSRQARDEAAAGAPVATTDDEVAGSASSDSLPQGGRVLVVDDDEHVARMICESLGKGGLLTRRVRGGREALSLLAREPFDLIVCDVKMPDMNGERLYEELQRVQPALARLVLWTTGDTLGSGPEELARRTGLDVLTKPFDLDELRDRVRKRLAR
jgi:two-component system NtrC family sensor kinase